MKNNNKIIIEADEGEFAEQKGERKTLRVLSFSIGGENYCIDINEAKEIIKLNRVTKVPNTPEFIAGVMNLRGEIISLIDIRNFFGLNESKRIEDGRVIATDIKGPLIGILIDKINETFEIEESSIQPPLSTSNGEAVEYTKGQVQLKEKILVFLDLDKILGCKDIEKLSQGGKQ